MNERPETRTIEGRGAGPFDRGQPASTVEHLRKLHKTRPKVRDRSSSRVCRGRTITAALHCPLTGSRCSHRLCLLPSVQREC